jgi:RES domain
VLAKDKASGELVKSLASALTALATHFTSPDDTLLHRLEKNIDALQEIRRNIEVERRRPTTKWTLDDVSRLYRLLVVFQTVMSLLGSRLETHSGKPWGLHLFSEHDFDLVSFDSFVPPTDPTAVKRMLEDQVTDLEEAVQDLSELAPSYRLYGHKAEVKKAVREIRKLFDLRTIPPLTLDLWDAKRVQDELRIDQVKLDELVASREVCRVKTWSGDHEYPSFQFQAGQVRPPVSYAHKNAAPAFSGWPFAVWAERHQEESKAFFKASLEKRGLWTPTWATRATNQFKDVDGAPKYQVPASSELFRVTRAGYSPFYFSSIPKVRTKSSQAGRFDLAESERRGSVYLSESAEGAWREVLDREPVVSLRTVVQRTMWTLTPNTSFNVANVTSDPTDIAACVIRRDTQQLAARLALHDVGIRYRLRTSGNEIGIVLFGPTGATLPTTAGLGIWSSQFTDAVFDASLWKYLDYREEHEGGLVILRRFPDEIVAAP